MTSDDNGQADLAREIILNNEVNENFKSALTLRFGGEYAVKKFRIRAGYSFTGSPLEQEELKNSNISTGFGYRGESYFLDLAFRRNMKKGNYSPYSLSDPTNQQIVDQKINQNKILLTLGLKF